MEEQRVSRRRKPKTSPLSVVIEELNKLDEAERYRVMRAIEAYFADKTPLRSVMQIQRDIATMPVKVPLDHVPASCADDVPFSCGEGPHD